MCGRLMLSNMTMNNRYGPTRRNVGMEGTVGTGHHL